MQALPSARLPSLDCLEDDKVGEDFERNLARMVRANEILAETYVLKQPRKPRFSVRLGFWAMHPVKGLAVLGLVLVGVFFVSFILYYFVNWKYLSELWQLG